MLLSYIHKHISHQIIMPLMLIQNWENVWLLFLWSIIMLFVLWIHFCATIDRHTKYQWREKRKKINIQCPHSKHQRPKTCFLLTFQMLQNCLSVIHYIKILNFPFYPHRTASNCLNLSKLLVSAIKLLKFSSWSLKALGPTIHLSDPSKSFRI